MDVPEAVEASIDPPAASQAGRLMTETFSSEDGVKDNTKVGWDRAEEYDSFASELIDLHACSLQMEQAYSVEGAELPVGKKISRNKRTVTHLGQGVFVQDNTIGIDPDSQRHPKTITTEEIRCFSRHCLDNSTDDYSLVIGTGHPGIGKTRGALAYTLQELLWRGEAVMRVSYKNMFAVLFLPGKSVAHDYRVWSCRAEEWMLSNLCGKFGKPSSLFVLIDPPEKPQYGREANCHVIEYASNNDERHIKNANKDGKVFVMKMPRLDEILCMEEVLYDETEFYIERENIALSKQERLEELCKRCSLVGCIPRIVFRGSQFRTALVEISSNASTLCGESHFKNLLRIYRGGLPGMTKGVVSAMSRFFFVEPSTKSREIADMFLNPATSYYIRNALQEQMASLDGNQAFLFEDVCALLLKGGIWQNETLPPRQIQCGANLAHTTKLILGLSNEQTLVRASNCYPVLDFATSPKKWYNAKVGESNVKVSLSAFVTLMCNLGFAGIDGQNRLVSTLIDGKREISLIMIRNSSVDNYCFDYKLAKKYENMDCKQIQEVFEQTVEVGFLNTANWSPLEEAGRRGLNGAFDARMELTKSLLKSYLGPTTPAPVSNGVQILQMQLDELTSQNENLRKENTALRKALEEGTTRKVSPEDPQRSSGKKRKTKE